jgi:hypothetical protein
MSLRVSDGIIVMIRTAIDGLDILRAIKDRIEWEVIPTLKHDSGGYANLVFMVGIGLPVPGTTDRIMPFYLVEDDTPEQITRVVRMLYASVQEDLDKLQGSRVEDMSPGGLFKG